MTTTLITAGLLVIKNKQLLLAFYLPGGKADPGETTVDTVVREVPTPSAEIGELRYFNTAAYRLQPRQAPGVVEVMRQLNRDGIID